MATSNSNTPYMIQVFCSLRSGNFPNQNDTFRGILDSLDQAARAINPSVSQGSLNVCHGDWYEWIIARSLWNFRIQNRKKLIGLLLPKVSSFDISNLYTPNLSNHINDLKQKVNNIAGVQLITSNPDFVVIDPEEIDVDPSLNSHIHQFTSDSIRLLQQSYTGFIDQCSFNNIVAYLAVKTSFRSDRRLQIPHEGSLMKATYIHLQTREWVINPKGLKYYAAASEVGPADRDALKTVATHSITNVQSLPQAAVDEVFEINTLQQANDAFEKILIY
ncbi:Cfr10I/Bse634I family restriction endonuclease [Synechococcus sp. PCC 6312]|uniref:Cfr10I/Bse634I family restriction endonuclease n=1 Tax=Synechococcus sp. (strain ATCC 27167 / PCC 6312) TaxID=195253 RepID=UPI00029ED980|nr:Cfr10I/Bse634I family restriction endonuclease [Synechococcus sp. PCC 6312]AFY60916.1 restriction endonuclease [Synechococcus sp. PCC 6312]